MTDRPIDDVAIIAAADLVGRSGARNLEIGYLDDDVPAEQARWYAHAQYRGARITAEDHTSPAAAAEALAQQVLEGGRCTHCGGLVAMSRGGAIAHPGAMADGSVWTEQEIRAAGQCLWTREGRRWMRGCRDTHPEHVRPHGPNRAERRRRERGKP